MSYDISGKIEASLIAALAETNNVIASLAVPFIVVGATARDIILEQCYGVSSIRRTLDIDLAIRIQDWKDYENVSKALLSTGKFIKARQAQRFSYKEVDIDIVPFGPIADADHRIFWPPEHEAVMSTFGFEEAYNSAITVRLSNDPPLDLKIPTIAGLAVMKLVSWREKYPERGKDAEDLFFLMKNYETPDIRSRLYESETALLKEEGFDTCLAGIRLLGRDMAEMSGPDTLARIVDILFEGTSDRMDHALIVQMKRPFDDFDDILEKVEKLKKGILEARDRPGKSGV
jgi:predicted nucleotidyltransferase